MMIVVNKNNEDSQVKAYFAKDPKRMLIKVPINSNFFGFFPTIQKRAILNQPL